MSASEKLRDLGSNALYDRREQIIAVVEAAETAYQGFGEDDSMFYAHQLGLADALAALDKVLP